ncbi:type II toxin-antitoxin system VapC family toxin [Exilibacterium tricleocarpae]|uniref:type II toxin-antitoxin system VapC family toxin n=1 Tax=Exilibacterium tricleocarpae TaxID=2591008 RepID=UPI0015D328E5|nr:type II toxin-antitoxin system VapC family toxin [Exilibacterium tricleocarpae]
MYLLDTNVISQLAKRQPDTGVVTFMKKAKKEKSTLYLSALTIGEINKGIAKLARYNDHQQADKLRQWQERLITDFVDSLLSVDVDTSIIWGEVLAATDDTNAIDKLIAATALQYDLTLVTRNIDHVKGTGAKCVNPFISV